MVENPDQIALSTAVKKAGFKCPPQYISALAALLEEQGVPVQRKPCNTLLACGRLATYYLVPDVNFKAFLNPEILKEAKAKRPVSSGRKFLNLSIVRS